MAIPRFELVVRGGTVVTPGRREIADIGVQDGRIAQIGGAMTGEGELGAHGLLVIPGGLDAHVHRSGTRRGAPLPRRGRSAPRSRPSRTRST